MIVLEVTLGMVAGVILLAILPTLLQFMFLFFYYAFTNGGKKQ